MSKSRPVVETLTEAFRGSLQCLQDSILIVRDSDSSYPFLIIIIIIIIINIIINIIIVIITTTAAAMMDYGTTKPSTRFLTLSTHYRSIFFQITVIIKVIIVIVAAVIIITFELPILL